MCCNDFITPRTQFINGGCSNWMQNNCLHLKLFTRTGKSRFFGGHFTIIRLVDAGCKEQRSWISRLDLPHWTPTTFISEQTFSKFCFGRSGHLWILNKLNLCATLCMQPIPKLHFLCIALSAFQSCFVLLLYLLALSWAKATVLYMYCRGSCF